KLLINGKEVEGRGAPLELVNPATGQLFSRCHSGDEQDVDDAVRAAQASFESGVWRDAPIHERAKTLNRFADLLQHNMEELYRLETLNNGRPITETKAQITRLPEWYRYNAALLLADRTAVVPMAGPYHSYTSRIPLGVIGILSSFNHP